VLAQLRQSFRFLTVKKVGVVANFAELDEDILVIGNRVAFLDALLL
jgi:hypothetical protein